MAESLVITVEATKQGTFNCAGLSCAIQATSPYDAATGHTSGKRQYKPFALTKAWDASSPRFFTALATNEILKTVTFQFLRVDSRGVSSAYITLTLTNAVVVDVKQSMDAATSNEVEEIALTFQKIELEDVTSKTTFSDDWAAV